MPLKLAITNHPYKDTTLASTANSPPSVSQPTPISSASKKAPKEEDDRRTQDYQLMRINSHINRRQFNSQR